MQNEGSIILRHCFSRNKQRQNRIQTFETLAEKDKKDTSFADLLMLAALYLQHNLARLIKYNAHAVAVVCDVTKLQLN